MNVKMSFCHVRKLRERVGSKFGTIDLRQGVIFDETPSDSDREHRLTWVEDVRRPSQRTIETGSSTHDHLKLVI